MAQKDVLSKHLLDRLLLSIAKYVLHRDILSTESLSTEMQRVEDRKADLVAKVVPREGAPFILHIEIQNNNHRTMADRMLRYLVDIRAAHPDYDVHQCLVYIGERPFSMPKRIETPQLNYHYDVLDFRHIDYHTFYAMDAPEALVLAILCDFGTEMPKAVVKRLLERLHQLTGENKARLRECVYMMEVLSDNRDLNVNIQEMYNMLEIHVERMPSYKMGLERGLEEGREEGRGEGREEGRSQGLQEGERRRAIKIAQSLLAMNLPHEQIALATQLPLEDVKRIALGEVP